MTATVTGEALRTCRDCGLQAWTEAELEGFVKNSPSKHGRDNLCGPCASAYARGWYTKNADRVREQHQAHYAANRDRILKHKRAYYEANREGISERHREYDREYRSGAFRDHLVWDVRELSYRSIHKRLSVHFGRASEYECVHCAGPAREWAYTQDDEDVRYDVVNGYTMAYSLKPEYYMPLCSGCHRTFDAEHREGKTDDDRRHDEHRGSSGSPRAD